MNAQSGSSDGRVGRERRGYKFERLRERIRSALNSGELSGKIPGERELARRFEANAKTIGKALKDLTAEGLLVRQVGRGTFVTASMESVTTRTTGKRFVWAVAADRKEPVGRLLFEQAAEAARADRHEMVLRSLQSSLNGMLSENSITAAELRGYDGLALFGAKPSGELLAELLRIQIGLVLVDVQSEAVRTNCVMSDIAGGAFALCEYLIALGHRDIRLAIDSDWLPCAAGAELGYRSAMIRHALTAMPAVVANVLNAPEVLFAGDCRPPAVVCVGTELARSVMMAAGRRRLQVPWDLSLAVVAEPGHPVPEHFGLTSYEIEPGRIASWVVRLLATAAPGQMPQMVVVPGRVVDRGSCRPPLEPTPPTTPTEGVL
ncbi:MAG: substrate-binding domain-containing protein [Phycisphaerae bacterium]